MTLRRAEILSVGTAVPQNVVTNVDLEKTLDTSDEWIRTRTGIQQRHIFSNGEVNTAFELGGKAVKSALDNANVSPKELDALICATFTPDNFFPSTACLMTDYLGCTGIAAFDISAACSGFVYALSIADSMIRSGQCNTIAVVGSEIISKTLDWEDRTTAILFGDGAGAVILRATDNPDKGILATDLSSDGSLGDILRLPAWTGNGKMHMKGSEVFKSAVRFMSDSTTKTLEKCNIDKKDVDLLIPHQANIRIIQSVAKRMGIPMEQVVVNLMKYGNTSSASIPLAMAEAWEQGRIKDGTVVALTALGGGVTVASAVIRF